MAPTASITDAVGGLFTNAAVPGTTATLASFETCERPIMWPISCNSVPRNVGLSAVTCVELMSNVKLAEPKPSLFCVVVLGGGDNMVIRNEGSGAHACPKPLAVGHLSAP